MLETDNYGNLYIAGVLTCGNDIRLISESNASVPPTWTFVVPGDLHVTGNVVCYDAIAFSNPFDVPASSRVIDTRLHEGDLVLRGHVICAGDVSCVAAE